MDQTSDAADRQHLEPLRPNAAASDDGLSSNNSSAIDLLERGRLQPKPPVVTSCKPKPDTKIAVAYAKVPTLARIENTFRSWGLSALYSLFVQIGRLFPRKRLWIFDDKGHITLFQDRRVALFGSLLHLVPVAGTATITYFVYHEFFVGKELAGAPGYDKFKLMGLQFAAKVHELLMVSTLTTIVFTLVRHELARGSGVPLASLTAGIDVSKVSFFWSKEFVAICKARYDTWYKKAAFIFVLLLCTSLCVAVAPASATVLVPINQKWDAGGTQIWLNSTKDQMFPSVLNDSHTLGPICAVSGAHQECPSARWQAISEGFLAQLAYTPPSTTEGPVLGADPFNIFSVVGRYSQIQFDVDTRNAGPRAGYSENLYSVVRAPHIAVADALMLNVRLWETAMRKEFDAGAAKYRFRYRSGEEFTTGAMSPMTFTKCKATNYTGTGTIPVFPDFRNITAHIREFIDNKTLFDFPVTSIIDTGISKWMSTTVANSSHPELFWFDIHKGLAERSSIGAVISVPSANKTASQIFGCITDARWAFGLLFLDQGKRQASAQLSPYWDGWDNGDYHRMTIRPSFAQYLNPAIPASNSTVFEEMAISSGLWTRKSSTGSGNAEDLEAVLNLMLVNGMARTAPYTAQQGTIAGYVNDTGPWWKLFMPQSGMFGFPGNAYTLTEAQKKVSYNFRLDARAQGYGYSRSSNASRLSITILLVQLAVAMLFILWSIGSGASSTSWDSPAELVALALASREPDRPQGLATGENSIESLTRRFCVGVEGGRVMLREWDGAGKLEVDKRIRPNVVYE